ncbi:phage tail tip fiber protein [Citrobacter braakii]|uniref:phage tail tip fiber protein n=1 Tax=Citrobacter braakii TaxID=57706 RepID=UPI001C7DFA7E|nr:DUF1983 domain-containing protein [Citrobacter braakii]
MSESLTIPHVKTIPQPFGVNVEWKWPGGYLVLELQCLHEDGRLVKERIHWPATDRLISGLKAGERLQVRLRPVTADGSTRDWQAADWIDGVSSVDTEEILQALDEKICNSDAFNVLKGGLSFEKNGTLIINNAQVFVTDAKIDDGMLSTNYSVKINVDHNGKQYASGMSIGVNDTATELRLSDPMQEAILKIVRDSDLFKSLVNSLDAQVASIAGLQQAIPDAVNDAIRNALKPGGLLYKR